MIALEYTLLYLCMHRLVGPVLLLLAQLHCCDSALLSCNLHLPFGQAAPALTGSSADQHKASTEEQQARGGPHGCTF